MDSTSVLSLKHHKSSIDPPPRPTIISSTSGSASANATPLAMIGPALSPCTGTLKILNDTRGFLCFATCKISCMTAPDAEVTTPIQLGKGGNGFLYFSSK